MSKITLAAVGSLIDTTTAANTINANTAAIVTAFDNTLSRDGTAPNTMQANIDMNSKHILNLPAPASINEPLRLADANTLNGGGTITVLPVGGTTGQVLEKNSSTNYDVSWQTLPSQTVTSITNRQCILSGVVDSTGFPGFANPGTALSVNLSATASPMVMSFASGFNTSGALDNIGTLSADVASYWSSIPANQYSFLSVDRNSGNGALTATQTLVRPQRGPVFYNPRQALLHFEGTLLDDWGNSWSSVGATFSSSVFKFGTQALRLNGSSSYCQSPSILNPGQGNWTIDTWVNLDSNVSASIFSLASAFGIYVATNGSGTLSLFLSSNGVAWDIANAVAGGTVVTATTWHHVALTFDGTTYRLFLDGAAQVSITGSVTGAPLQGAPIIWPECAALAVGYQVGATGYTAGYWDELSFVPYARWVAAFTPPVAAYTVSGDWFDTNAMVMKTATSAGPTWTPVQRLYVAEVTTGAATVSAVYDYNSTTHNSGTNLSPGTFRLRAGKKVYYVATPQFLTAGGSTNSPTTYILPPTYVPPDATCFYLQCSFLHAPINVSNYQDIAFVTRIPTGIVQNYGTLGNAFALYSGMGSANPALAFTEGGGQVLAFPVINGIASFEGTISNISSGAVLATITAVLLGYDLP